MAPDVGHAPVPTVARPIEIEWSVDALGDLDRFATFLHDQFPELAAVFVPPGTVGPSPTEWSLHHNPQGRRRGRHVAQIRQHKDMDMTTGKSLHAVLAAALISTFAAGCANTMRGVKADTETNIEKTGGGIETMDVKAALIADGRVDSGNINVDTSASTKTVVLKGNVPTADQRTWAEAIARDQAKGYKIDNQLTVVPK